VCTRKLGHGFQGRAKEGASVGHRLYFTTRTEQVALLTQYELTEPSIILQEGEHEDRKKT